MHLTADSILVRNSGLPHTALDADLIVLNEVTNSYVVLDDIGQRIWALLEAPTTLRSLTDQLAREYSGPRDQIAGDLLELLTSLLKDGVVLNSPSELVPDDRR